MALSVVFVFVVFAIFAAILFVALAIIGYELLVDKVVLQPPPQVEDSLSKPAADFFLQRVASLIGGEFKQFGPSGKHVVLKSAGRRYQIDVVRREQAPTVLKISTSWDAASFRMTVFPTIETKRMSKWIGMSDVKVGAPEFDELFFLQTNDQDQLIRSMTSQVQNRLTSLYQCSSHSAFVLSILGAKCTLEKSIAANQFEAAAEIVRLFAEICRMLGEMPTGDQLNFLEDSAGDESPLCMVCGHEIFENRVECTSCKTAHHFDCWEYMGVCSTYACGGKSYEQIADSNRSDAAKN